MIKLIIKIKLENMRDILSEFDYFEYKIDDAFNHGFAKDLEGIMIKSTHPFVPYKTGKLESSLRIRTQYTSKEPQYDVIWSAHDVTFVSGGDPVFTDYAFTQEVDPYYHHIKPDVGSRVPAQYAKRGTEAAMPEILNLISRYVGEIMNRKRGKF